uniref:Uncharacterized protein n=1 Tax=Lotharella vacuolata TaxID=74820 RepID=A0A0H5BK69_9EUKA|nr:hypothetical protein [Lotharella vacuolata]
MNNTNLNHEVFNIEKKKFKIKRPKNIYNQDLILKNEFKNYNKIFLRSIKHKKISELSKYILLEIKYENYLLNNHRFCQQYIEEERKNTITNEVVNCNNILILTNYWYHEKCVDQIMLHFKYKNILIFMNELAFYDNNIKVFYIY